MKIPHIILYGVIFLFFGGNVVLSAACVLSLSAGAGEALLISGSASMELVTKACAEAFMEEHPDIRVEIMLSGTGTGIADVQAGKADIAAVSRSLRPNELWLPNHLQTLTIGWDTIAVIAHKDVPVDSLTTEQLRSLYDGNVNNWSEIRPTADLPVVLIGREAGSGTEEAFKSALGTAHNVTQVLDSNGAVTAAVRSTPGAVGYASLKGLDGSVKLLALDGIPAHDKAYPLLRPFMFAYSGEREEIMLFIDFLKSEQCAMIIENCGVRQ